jgi:hypothetical protein
MAEDGTTTRCKHGTHPATAKPKHGMANRIDPVVHRVQSPAPNTLVDCPTADFNGKQLTS